MYTGKIDERTKPSHSPPPPFWSVNCTDKKENKIFLIYKEIQKGAVATF